MSGNDWSEKFKNRMEEKQRAASEERQNFAIYRDQVLRLFTSIEEKVKSVPGIKVSRTVAARTEEYRRDVAGPIDAVKSLQIRCGERTLEFIPDGVNTPIGKGRVRVRHHTKKLGQYVFLYLLKDPKSSRPYPDNLVWVIQDQKDGHEPTRCPVFDEKTLERVIEACFLEDS